MADQDKRLRYYNGQFLREQDFTAEQAYHLDRQRRHNRQLHTYGIAEGLTVNAGVGAQSATVSPGTAIDGEGRPIVLTESRTVPFGSLTGSVLVVISYSEQTSDPAEFGDEGDTRWLERPNVEVIAESGAPAADVRIRLARLQIAANGTVSQNDTSVRNSAGVRLGTEVAIERIRLSRSGVDQQQWPVLSSGAASQADVTGNLVVSGTVNGRNVANDGAKLDNLALSKIAGVSNPGGNVQLLGQNGITIAGNDTAKTITLTGGSPLSIAGVANAGGNIALAAGGAISITPDNTTNKQITISETHSAVTGNPHGTLAAQLGDYHFKNAFSDSCSFSNSDADGAQRSINLGFQPKLMWVYGYSYCTLSGFWSFGGVTNGLARLLTAPSTITQSSTGTSIYKTNTVPYVIPWVTSSLGIASSYFYDYNGSTVSVAALSIYVSSFDNTSLKLTFNKSISGLTDFVIFIYFHIFGS